MANDKEVMVIEEVKFGNLSGRWFKVGKLIKD
jgi:hypothetical protein